jgi:pimeloyl-ACP methyl ester carboxylesterase
MSDVKAVTHGFVELPGARLYYEMAGDVQYLEPPAVGRLAEIHVPTLVVVGEQDTSDVHAIGKLLQEQVAGAEVVMMANVAHTLSMEKPDELNQSKVILGYGNLTQEEIEEGVRRIKSVLST